MREHQQEPRVREPTGATSGQSVEPYRNRYRGRGVPDNDRPGEPLGGEASLLDSDRSAPVIHAGADDQMTDPAVAEAGSPAALSKVSYSSTASISTQSA